jgi:hypothetical protein
MTGSFAVKKSCLKIGFSFCFETTFFEKANKKQLELNKTVFELFLVYSIDIRNQI